MKINKGLVLIGLVLAVGAVAGVFILGTVINPDPVYVLAANVDINPNTELQTVGQESLVEIPMTGDKSMLSSLVTKADYLAMQQAGGQFINYVSRFEPLKFTDIMSSANPLSSRVISLGQDDPNMVVMTINVSGYAPLGLRAGDYIDIIASVNNYGTDAAYENSLANLMVEARKKALEGITLPDMEAADTGDSYLESETTYVDENGNPVSEPDYIEESQLNDPNVFTIDQPTITDEIMAKAEELDEKADNLNLALTSLQSFLDVYGSIDPVTLSEKLEAGYFMAPISKVLVQGSRVVNVNREESTSYDGTQTTLGDVTTVDVIVPRDAIEWVAMANEAGSLRIAVLSVNATPEGSGPTMGAALQDFIEAFVDDRGEEGKGSTIPSSR